jgi:hypothetical protein
MPRQIISALCGAGEGTRTLDLRITNAPLYQLSYAGPVNTGIIPKPDARGKEKRSRQSDQADRRRKSETRAESSSAWSVPRKIVCDELAGTSTRSVTASN